MENLKLCLNCENDFEINENRKQERKRKFCSKSCANSYNNKNIRYKKTTVESKKCYICKEEKNIDFFYKRKNSTDGYRNDCKDCLNKRSINNPNRKNNKEKYYQKNKEKIIEKTKKYYKENIDVIKKKVKINAKKNKKQRNKRLKYRYDNDLIYKLTISLRNTIYKSLKRNGFSKKSNTEEILGCSFEYFKEYIEVLFKDDMCWNNYGKWHIDHKTPSSWAKTEDELIKLNHYTNLQPLWANENLSKRNFYKN